MLPDRLGGDCNLRYSIKLWNSCLETSLKWVNQPGHTFVLYEQLVKQRSRTLASIYGDIGIVYNPRAQKMTESSKNVILPEWEWVKGASQTPKIMPSKFEGLFDKTTQEKITRSLKLDKYEQLKEAIIGSSNDNYSDTHNAKVKICLWEDVRGANPWVKKSVKTMNSNCE